jgi:hypothetical protein
MPAVSRAEQIADAIAEHHPSKLYKRNRGLLKMTHQQLHEFASTPRSNLPKYSKSHTSSERASKIRAAVEKHGRFNT